MENSDHDLLIEINANMKNLLRLYDKHVMDDKSKFDGLEKIISGIQKDRWIGYGVILAAMFIIRFLFKI